MERVIITPMGRGPLAGVLLVVWVGVADAGNNTRKVDIDSDPGGASVYLNSVDDGASCNATPCTIEAPIGVSNVILRKDGYAPAFGQIDVPKRGKVKPLKVSLDSALGTLIFDDPALKGGTILIDDVAQGVAPKHVDVEATGHHVVVMLKNKELFEGFPTVEANVDTPIKAKPGAATVAVVEPSGIDEGAGSGSDGTGNDDTKIKEATPAEKSDRYINVGAALEVNFRQFHYDNPKNGLNSQELESGQDLLGPAVEIWPMELVGASHLRGLSIFGKVLFGINKLQVLDEMTGTDQGTTTKWSNIEADLRHRWTIGDSGGIEVSGGFVRDAMDYVGVKAALDKVPVVDYRSIRLGVRGGVSLGAIDAYAGVEGRIVISAGTLATRFTSADVTGGRAVVGFSKTMGPIFARVEGSVVYYGWTITDDNSVPNKPTADGATDMVEVISINVGLVH
jgi:hypothetical protein